MCNFRKYFNDLGISINGVSKSVNDKNISIKSENSKEEHFIFKLASLIPILSIIGFSTLSFCIFIYLSSIQYSEYYTSSINIELITSTVTITIIFSCIMLLCFFTPSLFLFEKKDLTREDFLIFFIGVSLTSFIYWGSLLLLLKFGEDVPILTSISTQEALHYSLILSILVSFLVIRFWLKIKFFESILSSVSILMVNVLFLLFFSSFHDSSSWEEFTDKIYFNIPYFIFLSISFGLLNISFLYIINLDKFLTKFIYASLLLIAFYIVFSVMYNKYIFIRLGFVDKDKVPYVIDKDFWKENNLETKENISFTSILQDGSEKIFYIYCGKAMWKLGDHYLFQNEDEEIYPIPKNRIRKYLGKEIDCTKDKTKSVEENGD